MLHILNGDSTLDLLKETSLKGKFVVFREMLMEGPVTSVKGRKDAVDWKSRAAFLKQRFGIDGKKYLAGIKAVHAELARAARGNIPVTFWFEEDFSCQIHLIYLLTHLPAPLLKKGRVSLICPEKPLGVRLPLGLEKLFARRVPLDAGRMELAKRVWKAFAASSPKGWESLVGWVAGGHGFQAWPYLQRGLRCYLGTLPAKSGGFNSIEASCLRALSEGPLSFPAFFRRVKFESMIHPLGLGNVQVARYALDLALRRPALIKLRGPGSIPVMGKPLKFGDWKLQLTAEGKAMFPSKTA